MCLCFFAYGNGRFQNPKEFELSKELRPSVEVPGSFKEAEMLAVTQQAHHNHNGGPNKGLRSPSTRGKRPGSPSSSAAASAGRAAGAGGPPHGHGHHAASGQLPVSTSSLDALRDPPSDDDCSGEPSAHLRRSELRCHSCSGYSDISHLILYYSK